MSSLGTLTVAFAYGFIIGMLLVLWTSYDLVWRSRGVGAGVARDADDLKLAVARLRGLDRWWMLLAIPVLLGLIFAGVHLLVSSSSAALGVASAGVVPIEADDVLTIEAGALAIVSYDTIADGEPGPDSLLRAVVLATLVFISLRRLV